MIVLVSALVGSEAIAQQPAPEVLGAPGAAQTPPAETSAPDLQPLGISLSWERAEDASSCVDQETLERGVERRLGRSVFVPAAQAAISIEGSVERRDGRWRALFILKRRGEVLGSREIAGASGRCRHLSQPLALVLAIMVDLAQEQVRQERSAGPALALGRAAIVEPEPEAAAVSAQAAEEETEWHLQAILALGSSWGAVPGFGFEPRLSVLLDSPYIWSLYVEAVTHLLGEVAHPVAGGATHFAWELGGGFCGQLYNTDFAGVDLCVGGRGGQVVMVGHGFDQNLSQTQPLISATGRVQGRIVLARPLYLYGSIHVQVPFLRDEFVVSEADGSQTVLFQPEVLSAGGEIGLGVRLP